MLNKEKVLRFVEKSTYILGFVVLAMMFVAGNHPLGTAILILLCIVHIVAKRMRKREQQKDDDSH